MPPRNDGLAKHRQLGTTTRSATGREFATSPAMKLRCFTVGMFQVNVYLVEDPATGAAALVDTGENGKELARRIDALDPVPDVRAILLTHAHIDHAGGLVDLQARWDVTTYLPRLEQPMFDSLPTQGNWFGMPMLNRPCGRIDRWLDDGDEIELGELRLRFLSTPGHTPGQGCYYDDEQIIVGDTLFAGSVGRVDFPMSDPRLAKESLRRLMQLPPHLEVHSGHGPVTTLGEELRTNPFLDFLRRR